MNVSVVTGLLSLALGVLVVAFLGLGCRFFLAGIKYFNEKGIAPVERPGPLEGAQHAQTRDSSRVARP